HYVNGRFTSYTTKEGLPDGLSALLYSDRDNNLWVLSEGDTARTHKLSRYQNGRFIIFSVEDGLSDPVLDLAEDKQGNIWVSTTPGLCRYDAGKFTFVAETKEASLIAPSINGGLWVSSESSLARYTDGGFIPLPGYPTTRVPPKHIYENQDGSLWI